MSSGRSSLQSGDSVREVGRERGGGGGEVGGKRGGEGGGGGR